MKRLFTNEHLSLESKNVLYQGFFALKKYIFKHELFKGGVSESIEREVFERDPAVGVLLFDPALDQFVLLEQLRPGAIGGEKLDEKNISPWLLEIIAGMIEKGETPEQVAHREVFEEAGCKVKKLIPMMNYWVSPGGTTEYIYLYLGIVDSQQVATFAGLESEHEDIKVHQVNRQQLLKLLQEGYINNAMALIAIQWFLLNEQHLQLF